jgi:hypothetical protein
MRFWTAHADASGRLRLLREGFSWGALIFGPVWFAFSGAWIPAALLFAADLALLGLAPRDLTLSTVTTAWLARAGWLALAVLAAASARDLVRWSWQLHGFALIDVVAARDRGSAWQRLLDRRPDLPARTA